MLRSAFLISISILLFLLACDSTTNNSSDSNNDPVISLSGKDTININEGDAYEEPGYAALDSEDGDLKNSVEITWYKSDKTTITTSTEASANAGTYFIKYKITDSEGESTESWRCVIVKEVSGTTPRLVLQGNDTITIASFASFTEPGYSCLDTEDGDLKDSVKITWLDEDGTTTLDTSKNVTDTSIFVLKYSVTDKDENYVEKIRYIKYIPGGKTIELIIGTITPSELTLMPLTSDSIKVDVYCSKTLNTSDVSVKVIDDLGNENQYFNTAITFDPDTMINLVLNITAELLCYPDTYTVEITISKDDQVLTKSFSVIVKSIDPDSSSVTLDDFSTYGNDDEYDIQNLIGREIEEYTGLNGGGGGQWYAYASENGARIIGYEKGSGDKVYIIDSIGTTCTSEDMKNMTINNNLGVQFDCRDEMIDLNVLDYYYAGIACSIGGIKDSLGDITPSEINNGVAYWDFSELESITIDGKLEGSIKMFFEYKTENVIDPWGYHQISIEADIDKLEDISGDYLISDFKVLAGTPVAQSGITWEEASKKVCSFCIELDTDASMGGDLAVIEFDEIKFNFKNKAGKKKAFPFMD